VSPAAVPPSIGVSAPTRSLVSIEDVGFATAFLAHDAAHVITGETFYVVGGYHIIDWSLTNRGRRALKSSGVHAVQQGPVVQHEPTTGWKLDGTCVFNLRKAA
jgi:hypothetical protein